MRTGIALATLLLCSLSEAKLEDHFKRAPNKSDRHTMKNIDFIYMINLDKRPEKFQSCLDRLLPYGIEPYRFSAVNGWELSFDAINDLAVTYEPGMDHSMWGTSYLPENNGEPAHEPIHVPGKKYFSHCMSRGAIGIVLSHLSILYDALRSGYHTIWVMEDDIEPIRDPRILSDLVKKLDHKVGEKNWDILFTDRDTKNQAGEYVPCLGYAKRPNFSPKHVSRFSERKHLGSFIKTGARYGAYSMIVRRSGMRKILRFFQKYQVFLPYDMEFYLPDDIQIYSVADDVVSTQPMALSDNGGPNYLNK